MIHPLISVWRLFAALSLSGVLVTGVLSLSSMKKPLQISAPQFWKTYFGGQFLTLENNNGVLRGEARTDDGRDQGLAGLLRGVRSVPVMVSSETLRGYDYSSDPRFACVSAATTAVGVAYDAVMTKTYSYCDAAPYGKQRMAELFVLVHNRYGLPTGSALGIADVERALIAMIREESDQLNQPIAAVVWFLGECRQRSSSLPLIEVLRNSSYLKKSGRHLHFTAVDAAFSALAKVDDKVRLFELVSLMQDAEPTGRRKFASLFEHLISTDKLLSPESCGDRFVDPNFWRRFVNSRKDYSATDWDRYDVGSLFWELRYLAAVRLPVADSVSLTRLKDDYVATIRDEALLREQRSWSIRSR